MMRTKNITHISVGSFGSMPCVLLIQFIKSNIIEQQFKLTDISISGNGELYMINLAEIRDSYVVAL